MTGLKAPTDLLTMQVEGVDDTLAGLSTSFIRRLLLPAFHSKEYDEIPFAASYFFHTIVTAGAAIPLGHFEH